MHGVIAYTGSNPERFQLLRHAAEHFGASNVEARNAGNSWLGSFGSANAVHTFSDEQGVGVVYGSAAATTLFIREIFSMKHPTMLWVASSIMSSASLLLPDVATTKCLFIISPRAS